jgi:hypothetical protein
MQYEQINASLRPEFRQVPEVGCMSANRRDRC